MASLMDRSFEDRRIGREGLALDSTLTTVTLFLRCVPFSGPRPVDVKGKVVERDTAEKTKAVVIKGDFCRLASGKEVGIKWERAHARSLYT